MRSGLPAILCSVVMMSCGNSTARTITIDGNADGLLPPDVAAERSPAPDTTPAEPGVYYVSPSGLDADPGTFEHPFATVAHARDVVRSVKATLSRDVVVNLRAGTYPQPSTLALTAADSGVGGKQVIYQAYGFGTAIQEKPVVSGGRVVTGWSLANAAKKLWKADVGGGLRTRQLYVNGRRARRAGSASGIPGQAVLTSTGYTTDDTSMLAWKNPSDIEFVYTGLPAAGSKWTESRCGVAGIAARAPGVVITMKEPCFTNGTVRKCCNQPLTLPSSIENVSELLNAPGDWYLDAAARTLYYVPRAGEDMATAEVVVPVVETLLAVTGTPDDPVHDLRFRGIEWSHATWSAPSGGDGFIEIQANHIHVGQAGDTMSAPGSVYFRAARSIVMERNRFVHLGAEGLVLDGGSQGNVIVGNVFADISGTGVRVGDVMAPGAAGAAQDRDNLVSNNYVHDIAVEYHGGIGLMGGYVAKTRFSHNEIASLPYTGISLGWGWGETPSYLAENEVDHNHIHHLVQLLIDGGGVYLLNPQGVSATSGRTSIHHNYIHDQVNEFGSLYPDEGSAFMDIYANVIEKTPRWLHIWTKTIHDIDVRDNFSDTDILTNEGTNITMVNNYTMGRPWPAAASSIIDGAGLESAYRELLAY